MFDERCDRRGLCQEGVDALGLVSLEGVASEVLQMRRELAPDRLDLCGVSSDGRIT